jgi:hypothetical protein
VRVDLSCHCTAAATGASPDLFHAVVVLVDIVDVAPCHRLSTRVRRSQGDKRVHPTHAAQHTSTATRGKSEWREATVRVSCCCAQDRCSCSCVNQSNPSSGFPSSHSVTWVCGEICHQAGPAAFSQGSPA